MTSRSSVVVRARPDPDAPGRTVLRAEVVSVYDRLWALGLLSDAEREAADRVAISAETVARIGVASSLPGGGGGGDAPSERRLRAAGWLRETSDLLGAVETAWVIETCALAAWPVAPTRAEKAPGETIERLRAALARLAAWWEMRGARQDSA